MTFQLSVYRPFKSCCTKGLFFIGVSWETVFLNNNRHNYGMSSDCSIKWYMSGNHFGFGFVSSVHGGNAVDEFLVLIGEENK